MTNKATAVKIMSRFGFPIGAVLALGAIAWSASVSQQTEGACSPAVADVKGDVTIICKGVDPAVSNEVIRLLNEILKDTRKLEQVRRELDKTSKRTDEIEARQAPRRLTQDQRKQFVALLAGKSGPGYVDISAISNNVEAMQFAEDIGYALVAAGWKVSGVDWSTVLGVNPIGIHVWVRDQRNLSPRARVLLESFRTIGLDVTVRESPASSDDRIAIWVASKPL